MGEFAIAPDGVQIHYEVQGQGTPALVFVHGWCCNQSHWQRQMEHFADQYTAVAVDLVGHGQSGQNRDAWTMPAFGQDVVAVVKKLKLTQVVLVGHSMGGTVIIEAAKRMLTRVIGLVAADTFRELGQTRTREEVETFISPFHIDFRQACEELVRTRMFTPTSDAAFVEAIVEELSAAPAHVGIAAGKELFSYDAEVQAGLQSLPAPIHAFNADYHPTDMDAARQYGLEVKFMANVGHFVMMEEPKTFNQLLEESVQQFLAAIPAYE